jgi:putative ABC transport system permease protein
VGIALNENETAILANGYWSYNFFNSKLSTEHKNGYDSQSVYLFCKKSVDVIDYIDDLRVKYPGYAINNDIADLNASVEEVLAGIRTVLIVLSSISIVVAILLISMVSFISIIERKQEVGVMRTMGARKTDILMLFLNENIFLGIISSIIAFVMSTIFSIIINSIFKLMLSVISYGLIKDNFNIVTIDIQAIITVFICAIGLTILASIVPSLKISKVDPVAALKKK